MTRVCVFTVTLYFWVVSSTAKGQYGPKITEQPRDSIFYVYSGNKTVQLSCRASGDPPLEYSWRRDRDGLGWEDIRSGSHRYNITGGNLIILEPEYAIHEAKYQCTATNIYGSVQSNPVHLNFGYINDFPRTPRTPVHVLPYLGNRIECNPPSHFPEANTEWLKETEGSTVQVKADPRVFVSHDTNLYFSSTTREDDAEYSCLIYQYTPNYFKLSMPSHLRMFDSLPREEDLRIIYDFPKVFPTVPMERQSLRLECVAFGSNVRYSWTKDGGPLPTGVELQDYNRVLYFREAASADVGEYSCTAYRPAGHSETKSVMVTLQSGPSFTLELQDQAVRVGDDVTFRCSATCNPPAAYTWYRNTTPLHAKEAEIGDMKDSKSVNGSELTLRNVQVTDIGMYQCEASNVHGTRLSTAQLSVCDSCPSHVPSV